MKSRITRCLLLISLIPLIFGAEYPNAWTDFEECGLEQPGYVCDPDNLMDPIDLIDLNNYIHTYFQVNPLKLVNVLVRLSMPFTIFEELKASPSYKIFKNHLENQI